MVNSPPSRAGVAPRLRRRTGVREGGVFSGTGLSDETWDFSKPPAFVMDDVAGDGGSASRGEPRPSTSGEAGQTKWHAFLHENGPPSPSQEAQGSSQRAAGGDAAPGVGGKGEEEVFTSDWFPRARFDEGGAARGAFAEGARGDPRGTPGSARWGRRRGQSAAADKGVKEGNTRRVPPKMSTPPVRPGQRGGGSEGSAPTGGFHPGMADPAPAGKAHFSRRASASRGGARGEPADGKYPSRPSAGHHSSEPVSGGGAARQAWAAPGGGGSGGWYGAGKVPATPPARAGAKAAAWPESPDVTTTHNVEEDLAERLRRAHLAEAEAAAQRERSAAAGAEAAHGGVQGAAPNGAGTGAYMDGEQGEEGTTPGRKVLRARRRYFNPPPGSPGPGSNASPQASAFREESGEESPTLKAEARAAAWAHAGVPTGEEKREALLGELRRNCEVYKSLGNSAYGRADYGLAISSYERAVESAGLFSELFDGANPQGEFVDTDGVTWNVKSFLSIIHSNLSAARQMLGDSGMLNVLAECITAVRLDASNVRALVRLGQVRIKLGLLEDARKDLSLAFTTLSGSDPRDFGLIDGAQEAGQRRKSKVPVGSAEAMERWGDDKVKALLAECSEGLTRCKEVEATEAAADAALASGDVGKIEKSLAHVQGALKIAAHSPALAALRAHMLMRTGASRRAFRFCDAWASNYDAAVRGKHAFECEQQRDAHGANRAGIAVLRARARFYMGSLDDAVSLLSTLIENSDEYQCAVRAAGRGEGHAGCCPLDAHLQEVCPRLAAECKDAPALLSCMKGLAKAKRAANEAYQAGDFARAESLYSGGLTSAGAGDSLVVPPAVEAIFHSNRGAALKGLERWPEAIAACSKATSLDPGYLRAVVRRAQLWGECGLCGEAADDWDRSVALLEQALAEDSAAAKTGMGASTKSGATKGELADAKRSAKEQRQRSAKGSVANHWRLLGMPAGSSDAEVKTAFRKAALKLHPDKTGGTTSTLFNAIREAHDTLSDATKRAEWEANVAREARRNVPQASSWSSQPPFSGAAGRASARTSRPKAYPSTQNHYYAYEQPFRPGTARGGASSKENRNHAHSKQQQQQQQGYYHTYDYGSQGTYTRGDRAYHNVPKGNAPNRGAYGRPRNPYTAGGV